MKLSTIITAILAIVGAFALAIVTRIIIPSEKVNALWLVVAASWRPGDESNISGALRLI